MWWVVHPLWHEAPDRPEAFHPSPVAPSLLLLLDLEYAGQTALRPLPHWQEEFITIILLIPLSDLGY